MTRGVGVGSKGHTHVSHASPTVGRAMCGARGWGWGHWVRSKNQIIPHTTRLGSQGRGGQGRQWAHK